MSRTRRPARAGFLAAITMGLCGMATAADYAPVTEERLKNPEPENWLSWRGNYQGWGYSPLDHINASNVKDLVPVWSYATGLQEGHQAPPIVNNGVMFVSTPENNIIALDAATGVEKWRYRRKLPKELFQLHPTNRGVGLYKDKVYLSTLDACVVALNATDGKEAWSNCVGDWKIGEYSTLSPLVADGKIITGVSGGEFGIRGHITALNADTGEVAWKTYTIPAPGEPGSNSWRGEDWKTGGGSVWMQGNYDPETKLAYFGTGNGAPWMPDTRPGDNLYTSSVLAIDVTTGAIKGHHQYHWNDAWDWDEVSAPLLIDYERNGKKVKGLVHAGRNGYLWWLSRGDGDIGFVEAENYVEQTVFDKIDEKTGRPSYNQDKVPLLDKTVKFCPSLWGGKDWPPEAYNPKTGLLYIPSHINLCSEYGGAGKLDKLKPGELWLSVPVDVVFASLRFSDKVDTSKPVPIGSLQAFDVKTGKRSWATNFNDTPFWAPLLTTGGNLVFAGGTVDRKFRAMDATDGKILWETALPSGVTGVPSSFSVNGTQYIAVQSGWGVDAERMHALMQKIMPEGRKLPTVPQGGSIWVFALKK
ncbi:MAG TPA: PQQ-dependent dehydrogenase, methanol/ethanol family [Hyphomicrobium sp.]|nr:PQQ-dependent dehydrogenase, methanol/ethanol family [Hyphomicrobium sp.]